MVNQRECVKLLYGKCLIRNVNCLDLGIMLNASYYESIFVSEDN